MSTAAEGTTVLGTVGYDPIEAMLDAVLAVEGEAYTDDPADNGGPTKWGITIKTLSEWLRRRATPEDVMRLTRMEAKTIYRAQYVLVPGFAQVGNALVKELLVDTGINHGRARAVRWLQEILNHRFQAKLAVDGRMGPATLDAVNKVDPRLLTALYVVRRQRGYADLVQTDPKQLKWLEGWINRTGRFVLKLV